MPYPIDASPLLSSAGVQSQACLREENDSLRWQLDAYRNEVELLRKEQGKAARPEEPYTNGQTPALLPPDGQVQLLQQNMHNMQQVRFTC